jgi:hypothetical protein
METDVVILTDASYMHTEINRVTKDWTSIHPLYDSWKWGKLRMQPGLDANYVMWRLP